MSSYISIETKYNRDERVLDLPRFAKDICKVLGGKLVPRESDQIVNDRYVAFTLGDDVLIGLTKGWKQSEIDKVTVTIAPFNLKLAYGDTPRGAEYKTPEATISTSRPLGKIAADITRRVIEPGKAPLAKLREHAATCDQQRVDLKAVADELRLKHPHLQVTVKEGERFSGSLYRNANDEPYLSGSVRADGSVSIDRLGSLTPAQFKRLMTALYGNDK